MPTLNVRDVPKPLYERIRKLAEREKRSLSQEVLWILERHVEDLEQGHTQANAWKGAELLREKVREYMAPLTAKEMVKLVREDRDR